MSWLQALTFQKPMSSPQIINNVGVFCLGGGGRGSRQPQNHEKRCDNESHFPDALQMSSSFSICSTEE